MSTDIDKVSKVIILSDNHILLLNRVDGKGWELPGGHLNAGETFIKGATRETREETGLKISKFKLLIKESKYRLFLANTRTRSIKLSKEHIDYLWVNRRQLKQLNLTKYTVKNLKFILKCFS